MANLSYIPLLELLQYGKILTGPHPFTSFEKLPRNSKASCYIQIHDNPREKRELVYQTSYFVFSSKVNVSLETSDHVGSVLT